MDGLQRQYGEKLRVERFNVGDEAGRQVYEDLNATGVPTTVLYDPAGSEVYRAERKVPRPRAVRDVLARLGIHPR
ncbi:MAG: hypothetical protein M3Q29_11690 [Chloroflexota bacterium]|nr:hypothetical protein [Chloroflexota bacterium]